MATNILLTVDATHYAPEATEMAGVRRAAGRGRSDLLPERGLAASREQVTDVELGHLAPHAGGRRRDAARASSTSLPRPGRRRARR